MCEALKKNFSCEVNLLNASLGGTNTEAAVAYTTSDLFFGMSQFNADIALIEKIVNERIKGFSKLNPNQKNEHISNILRDTGELIDWCLRRNIEPILICSHFAETIDYGWDTSQENGYLRSCYEKIASSFNISLIDVHGHLQKEKADSTFLLDEVHLNDLGATKVAEILTKEMHYIFTKSKSNQSTPTPYGRLSNQPRKLQILHKGSKKEWQSKLLKTKFDPITFRDSGKIVINLNEETQVSGVFFISDPWSSHIKLIPDGNLQNARLVKTFDHMSFFERVNYKPINNLSAKNTLEVSTGSGLVDIDKAIQSYFDSKMFNPQEEWCINKYLNPLYERKNNPTNTEEKIIAIFGRGVNDS